MKKTYAIFSTLLVLGLAFARPVSFHVENGLTGRTEIVKVAASQNGSPLLPAARQGRAPHYDNSSVSFHSHGDFTLEVAPGDITVKLQKGYLFRPATYTFNVPASGSSSVTLKIYPWMDYRAYGWYPGDPHTHDPRATINDSRAQIISFSAEGRDVTFNTAHNFEPDYSPIPNSPHIYNQQLMGFGDASDFGMQSSFISSGQEYLAGMGTFGHIIVMCQDSMVWGNGPNTKTEVFPHLNAVMKQGKALRGFTLFCHTSGSSSPECFADVALNNLDYVELNGVPGYGGDMWGSWFTGRNSGRTIAHMVGTDNTLSMGLTVAYTGDTLSPRNWAQHAAWGMNFTTNGPMVFLRVNDKGPGQFVTFPGSGPQTVEIEGTALSEIFPIKAFRLRQDGRYHDDIVSVSADSNGRYAHFKTTVTLNKSAWFCAIVQCDSVPGVLPTAADNVSAMSGAVTVMIDRRLPVVRNGDPYAVCTVDGALGEVQSMINRVNSSSRTQAQKDAILADFNKAKSFYTSLLSAPPSNDPAPGPVTGLRARVTARTQADYLRVPEVIPAPASYEPVWN